MKKILTLLAFAAISQVGFAQLDVHVREDGDQLVVQFPAGQTFEYKINLVDPIAQGTVEMQFSKVRGGAAPTDVAWHTAAGMNYELAYRYPLATGELSDWYKIDPRVLLESEGK
jgi:hypothetical protein